jgi:chromodomain-helicase-DNA-binding protein 1
VLTFQVKEAKLENKNRVVIIQTCEDIITQAEDAVNAHKANIRDLQDRGEPPDVKKLSCSPT